VHESLVNWQLSAEAGAKPESISVSRWASEAPRGWDICIEHQRILVALCRGCGRILGLLGGSPCIQNLAGDCLRGILLRCIKNEPSSRAVQCIIVEFPPWLTQ